MLTMVMLKTISNPYCLSRNHEEFDKTEPIRSDSTIHGAGVFSPMLPQRARRGVFNLWMLVSSALVQFFSWLLLLLNHLLINGAVSTERTIAIFVFMFLVHLLFGHG